MTSVISISHARANLPNLIAQVSNALSRVVITVNGQAKALLISAEELESLEETAEVLSIPGIKRSIAAGMKAAKKGQGVTLSQLKLKKAK